MVRTRTKKTKNAQLPLFIEKLVQMLEDESIDNIISWTSTHDSFNIKSITQFTQQILPKYFKHNNFSSFIRQLNMYGFRKIRHEDGQNVYENENFKKGNKSLLKNIKRKINQQKEDKLALYNQEGPTNQSLSRQVQEMKNKQKDLQQICRHLLMQNQKLIDENNALMKKMKDQSRKKERKIQQLMLTFMAASQNRHPTLVNQENGSFNNMLSLVAGDGDQNLAITNENTEQTPLEMISNALSRNKNMRNFRQMLENYCNSDYTFQNGSDFSHNHGKKKKFNSHSYVTPIAEKYSPMKPQKLHNEFLNEDVQSDNLNQLNQQELIGSGVHQNQNPENLQEKAQSNKPNDDEEYVSINEFMNLEDDDQYLKHNAMHYFQDSN